jgi:Protein of unknown function (DUF1566)
MICGIRRFRMDTEMRNRVRFLLIMASLLLLLSQAPVAGSAGRFVDNGDGTVTDTRRQLMWQKDDNGEEVTFEGAQKYCKTLRLGGHADWRLPEPEERETAVVTELMMRRHSRDVYARFDLYWSSDPTTLIPFNYHPSYGKEVLRVYPARKDDRAFVRAVRSIP